MAASGHLHVARPRVDDQHGADRVMDDPVADRAEHKAFEAAYRVRWDEEHESDEVAP